MSIRLQAIDFNVFGWDKTTSESNDIEAGDVTVGSILGAPVSSITDGDVNGDGAFDKFMKSIKAHLQEEYDAQRITGDEYAKIYLASISMALQQANAYVVNKHQVELLISQIGLVRQQTATELANTDDTIPEGLGFNFKPDTITTIPPVMKAAGAF